jgi:hypothetical protein
MKFVVFIATAFVLFAANIANVFAVSAPEFPTCSNPSGSVKVEYQSGNHAIVGETSLRQGSDKVYSIENGNYMQCFCPEQGSGIQTNWWRLGQIDQKLIDSMKSQGWHYIPDGSDWGLTSDPYLAKNNDYSCNGGTGGGTTSSGIGGGVSDSVLGLAATGDNKNYIALISLGISFIAGGLLIRKSKNA